MRLHSGPRIRAAEILPAGWAAGEPIQLAALAGRVVLLDFFSFAEPEGMLALPRLRELAEHYREPGLTVAGVHVPAYAFERDPDAAREEIWRLGIPYPVALDQGLEAYRAYGAGDLPARYVIDAGGYLRGAHRGPGGLEEIEHAVRTLLREANEDIPLPSPLPPFGGLPRPGALLWHPTPEIRFGSLWLGFGADGETKAEREPEGEIRDFGPLSELRAEGRPTLAGPWRLENDGIVSAGEAGGGNPCTLAVVFEGTSVAAVLSREAGTTDEEIEIRLTLDGEPPTAHAAGFDVDDPADGGLVRVGHGRLYRLIEEAPFGVHNLEIEVPGPGLGVHLLHFGTEDVPREP